MYWCMVVPNKLSLFLSCFLLFFINRHLLYFVLLFFFSFKINLDRSLFILFFFSENHLLTLLIFIGFLSVYWFLSLIFLPLFFGVCSVSFCQHQLIAYTQVTQFFSCSFINVFKATCFPLSTYALVSPTTFGL